MVFTVFANSDAVFADFDADFVDFTDFWLKTSKTDNQFSFHCEDPRGKHKFLF